MHYDFKEGFVFRFFFRARMRDTVKQQDALQGAGGALNTHPTERTPIKHGKRCVAWCVCVCMGICLSLSLCVCVCVCVTLWQAGRRLGLLCSS